MRTTLALLLVALASLMRPSQLASQVVTLYTKEEIPMGDEIGNLKERFSFPEGSTFTMVFPSEEIQRLIKLDSKGGILHTIDRLDRETLCPSKPRECERTFNVEVKRGSSGDEENLIVRLVINDVNDQRPKFESKDKNFFLNIPESDSPPSQYSLPTAEDKDSESYDNMKYELEHRNDSGLHFKLSMEERGGKGIPKLELIRPLDRESKDRYEMLLLVSDAEYPEEKDRAQIIIKVLDANDNKPKWQLSTQSITISECDSLHRGLLQLQATDADLRDKISYYIGKTASKEIAGSFYISGNYYLSQNQSIDYEKIRKNVLYIPLVAEDKGGLTSEMNVELRVTDCNDHYPNITVQIIDDKILENDEGDKVLARILVRDEDEGNNGTVDCAVGENYRHKIDLVQKIVDTAQQTIYKLKKLAQSKFDRESTTSGEITVEIICTDKGHYPKVGRKEIKLKIVDENDNHPKLEHQLYKFRIRENSAQNTLVGSVSATDADSEDNARLKFSLDSEGSRYFNVKGRDNRAEIYSAVSFDREVRDVYRFALIVVDGGQEPRSSTASIEVTIDDEDDSAPVFKAKEYTFRINEDYDRNVSRRLIGQVEATDEDIGVNRVIWYDVNRQYQSQLSSSGMGGLYFYFNQSYLYGDGNFDREKQETISLEVFALNRGPSDHRGTARVTITMQDVNDNHPVIQGLHKVYNLSESSPAGTQVLQVKGTDEDSGENGTLTYRLEGTDFGHFGIDSSHGIVTLISSLKDKSTRTYKLNIRAQDNGRPSQHSALYSTFVHVNSGQAHRQRVDAPVGSNTGKNKVQRRPDTSDQNLLILLCLAAIVFVVFVALLVILLYVHAKGRRDARSRASHHPDVWYDKANGEIIEEPIEATEPGIPIGSSVIVRNKFPSFGYISSIDKQRAPGGGSATMVAAGSRTPSAQHYSAATAAGTTAGSTGIANKPSYYETYGKGSDRLPRRAFFHATTIDAAAAAVQSDCNSHNGGGHSASSAGINKDYSNLIRVEENRYAEQRLHHQQGGLPQTYAMLAETVPAIKQQQQQDATTATVCRTPYMTSSFV